VASRFDVLVLGGGTAGCVLASRLSEDAARSVCLVEAGPDYGPFADGHWPAEMLDARTLPMSHLWGQQQEDRSSSRARIIGGCSAHNACIVVWGARSDYDEWCDGWTFPEFEPYLRRAEAMLRARRDRHGETTPWHDALLAAAARVGLPRLDDVNDLDATSGGAPFPTNAVGAVRWNTAFAYLDEARRRSNLVILADTLVDRVLLDDGRAVGVETTNGSLRADTVVVAAGAYGSPLVLLRSGIGPAGELHDRGIESIAELPVGRGLADHPAVGLEWAPTEALVPASGRVFEPSVLIRACSRACPPGTWDLHILPWTSETADGWQLTMVVYLLKPDSRGSVHLASRDPGLPPVIEHGFLRDQRDLERLVDAVDLGRRLAEEAGAGAELRGGERVDLEAQVRETVRGIFHPTGTCAIGSVVDGCGRVLGVEGLIVADASIMPTIPRANTNLTTVALAERLSELV
jgi:choline dehydrogenase